jgi:hypothetical protein
MQFNLRTVVWIGFLLGTGLFLGGAEGQGCGGKSVFESMADDGTDEAKLEKARIALDEGAFADAVEILTDLCGTDVTAPTCDPEVVSLYASAFAGRAGLDMIDLIREGADQQATSGTTSYTLFSKHFDNPSEADVNDMSAAVSLLTSIASRTPGQGLQLAVVSTVDLVVFLGSLTGGYDPTTGKPNTIPDVSAITLGAVSRVLADIGNMGTGLTEAGIDQNESDISDHIQLIRGALGGDASSIVTFLGNL